MIIIFRNGVQNVTANRIIRCEVDKVIFHVAIDDDVVDVFCCDKSIKCYEADNKKIKEVSDG